VINSSLPPKTVLRSLYRGQPVLAGTPCSELLLQQSFTVRMTLLTATSAFGLRRIR